MSKVEFGNRPVINLSSTVLCACNGKECDNPCRANHLKNDRTGICVSAYNPPRVKDPKAVRRIDTEKEYLGVFGEY